MSNTAAATPMNTLVDLLLRYVPVPIVAFPAQDCNFIGSVCEWGAAPDGHCAEPAFSPEQDDGPLTTRGWRSAVTKMICPRHGARLSETFLASR
jgi:hypothetical protein